jgi:hypothetical protein
MKRKLKDFDQGADDDIVAESAGFWLLVKSIAE